MILLLLALSLSVFCDATPVTVSHTHAQKVGMRIAYLGCAAQRVAQVIAADMGCSGHYAVTTQEYRVVPSKKTEITALVGEGIIFLLILESDLNLPLLSYRLYDTTTGQLIAPASGKCTVNDDTDARYGHQIADQIWQQLMGSASIFNTHLAYAKEVPYKKNLPPVKHICISDYDGRNEKTMVSAATISIAPRWGGTKEAPLIFYSEYTKTNVRLMAVDARKKRAVVTRYDGTSMYLTPNHDRSMHAFESSRGSGKCHIYIIFNKDTAVESRLEQCTFGESTDASPTFNHDSSRLYYCSDGKIMVHTFATKKVEPLPISGYCVSPAYNPKRNLIAYCKSVDGLMQICVFDTVTKQEKQLTNDVGHHAEPTWSPCGNFLAYTHQVGSKSRIRTHCYATGHEQYVTPAGVNCSYPAWSLY